MNQRGSVSIRRRLLVVPVAAAVAGTTTAGRADAPTGPPPDKFHGLTAKQWAQRFNERGAKLRHARMLLRRRWRPTVHYSLRLASAATGVSYRELAAVSWCESRQYPFAVNGRYKGLFQLGWAPFGLDPFDPLANALSAAMTVRHDGGWRQWECKP